MTMPLYRRWIASLMLVAVCAAGSSSRVLAAAGHCPLASGTGDATAAPSTLRPTRQRIGDEYPVARIETAHPYRAGRGTVQIEEIHVPGASYVAPYFARVDLAPGDHLIGRSPDGARRWRYEGEGKPGLGRTRGFWGIHVPGERVVIELHGAGQGDGWGYRIEKVARGFALRGDPPNPICGQDDKENARCYEHSHPTHYQQARAVARLLISGQYLCTGWLIGSEGHLMTNGHCIESAEEAANTNYEFMAEGGCAQTCGTLQCPGTIVSTYGTLIRRNYPTLDYSLVRLDSNPSGQYGYLTLRAATAAVGELIYLPQHPSGWGKQIALYSTHPLDPTGYPQIQNVWPNDVRFMADVYYGTSGSPVLSHGDHCVVALQHGTLGCETQIPGNTFIGNVGSRADLIIGDLGTDLPIDAVAYAGNCLSGDTIFSHGFQ